MKVKTKYLIVPALDWAVDSCKNGRSKFLLDPVRWLPAWKAGNARLNFSTDWSQGGPIIESERLDLTPLVNASDGSKWACFTIVPDDQTKKWWWAHGPTALVAAMRCYVKSKLGLEVDVPDELL